MLLSPRWFCRFPFAAFRFALFWCFQAPAYGRAQCRRPRRLIRIIFYATISHLPISLRVKHLTHKFAVTGFHVPLPRGKEGIVEEPRCRADEITGTEEEKSHAKKTEGQSLCLFGWQPGLIYEAKWLQKCYTRDKSGIKRPPGDLHGAGQPSSRAFASSFSFSFSSMAIRHTRLRTRLISSSS